MYFRLDSKINPLKSFLNTKGALTPKNQSVGNKLIERWKYCGVAFYFKSHESKYGNDELGYYKMIEESVMNNIYWTIRDHCRGQSGFVEESEINNIYWTIRDHCREQTGFFKEKVYIQYTAELAEV